MMLGMGYLQLLYISLHALVVQRLIMLLDAAQCNVNTFRNHFMALIIPSSYPSPPSAHHP
jgi:hypothetical protein